MVLLHARFPSRNLERDGRSQRTLGGALVAGAALGGLAWAARGRSSAVFGPSVWRGPRGRNEVALTFDDGPSPSTPHLLKVLDAYGTPATFFQCGEHVRRLPAIAREVCAAGHEIGNHTDTHPRLWLRSPEFLFGELLRAQDAIGETTGHTPKLFRAPYGVRWFGLREAQSRLGLTHVMWTTLGRDWKLDSTSVSGRLLAGCGNGSIFCLHDGRERNPDPNIENTVQAVRHAIPVLLDRGFRFVTVSELLR